MQRAVGTVLVVVLVVSAGCSAVFGGGGGSEPTSTVTPMAVPTDEPTPTPVPQLAPGLTGEGIENASALVAAHASVLRNTSFTVWTNTTELAANGSVVFRQTSTHRAGSPGSSVYTVSKRNGSSSDSRPGSAVARIEAWSNGTRGLLKWTYANGTTAYKRIGNSTIRSGVTGIWLRYILTPFGTANTSVTELERNGTTLYRVRGRIQDAERGNVSVRLIVDQHGLIRKLRVFRRETFEGTVSRTVNERQFSKIGATDAPERPTWVDEAINRTAPAPRLAPGLTEEGIENASALVAGHTSVLHNTSFTKHTNTTRLAANGSAVFRRTSTSRVGPPGEGLYSVTESNGSYVRPGGALLFRSELWSDGERILEKRTDVNGTTIYDRPGIAPTKIRNGTAQANLRYHLERFRQSNTAVTDRFTTNGTTLHLVNGTARNTERRNVSIWLVVDSRGVVHEYRISREIPFDPNATQVVTHTQFIRIGATDAPERPSWIDAALNRTVPVSNRTTVTPNAMTATPNATTATATNRTETASTTTAGTTTRR